MEQFSLQKSTRHPGWWVCVDDKNGIVCRFEEHRFNETQKITFLEDYPKPDPMAIARLLREMGEWLFQNHKDKAL